MAATATANAVTMRESQAVMQNLLSASMCEIFFSRKLLPKECFESVKFAGNTLHRFKNNLENAKADTLYRWIKEDVVDALKKKILHRLVLGIYLSPACAEKDLLESYTFSFGYDGDSCSLGIETQRHKNSDAKDLQGHDSIKQNTQILVRSLIAMLGTLEELPKKYFLSIRMHYYHTEEYESFTPHNFQIDPSFEDTVNNLDNLQIGGFNTGFHSVAVNVKTQINNEVQQTSAHAAAKSAKSRHAKPEKKSKVGKENHQAERSDDSIRILCSQEQSIDKTSGQYRCKIASSPIRQNKRFKSK